MSKKAEDFSIADLLLETNISFVKCNFLIPHIRAVDTTSGNNFKDGEKICIDDLMVDSTLGYDLEKLVRSKVIDVSRFYK